MGDQPEPPAPLTIAEEHYFGGFAPTQGEGILSDGRHYYLRIRHMTATLWVGPAPYGECEPGVDGHTVGVAVRGVDGDPHIWSYVPRLHARALLDLLLWTFGDSERVAARVTAGGGEVPGA